MQTTTENDPDTARPLDLPTELQIREPVPPDGAGMWRVARDSGDLDLNSSYAYLLFVRDFAATCRVAVLEDRVVGFLLGYRRPAAPERLFVWQVAVDDALRGRRLAGRLLDAVVDATAPTVVETTVTEANLASRSFFVRWAARRDATITSEPLFAAEDFPDGHDAEPLLVISGLEPR